MSDNKLPELYTGAAILECVQAVGCFKVGDIVEIFVAANGQVFNSHDHIEIPYKTVRDCFVMADEKAKSDE